MEARVKEDSDSCGKRRAGEVSEQGRGKHNLQAAWRAESELDRFMERDVAFRER